MREILFRRAFFFDEEKTKFSHFGIWGVKVKGSEFTSPAYNNFASFYIDEQFIGLLDKNGTKIFEGDVYFEEIEHDHGDERNYFVVTWIDEWAMFSLLSISENYEYIDTGVEHLDRMMPFNIEPDDIEKLHRAGNIHDNPELLK